MSDLNGNALDDQRTQPLYFGKFILQTVLTTVGSILAVTAFTFLRSKNGSVYGRRHKFVSLNLRFVKSTTLNVLNLIKIVYQTSEKELHMKVGMDGMIFLRYCKLQITYTMILLAFGLILLPVNFFGGTRNRSVNINKLDLSAFSLTNLETPAYLWFHITISWLSAFILYYLLYKNNIYSARLVAKERMNLSWRYYR